ncbi:recombinase family protein, partial [Bacillus velezensis]
YMSSFAEMVNKDLSMSEKRNFLDFFIEKVTLYDDDHMEVVWKNKTLNGERSQKVDFTEDEPEEDSDNQHKRLNRIQAYGRQTA